MRCFFCIESRSERASERERERPRVRLREMGWKTPWSASCTQAGRSLLRLRLLVMVITVGLRMKLLIPTNSPARACSDCSQGA